MLVASYGRIEDYQTIRILTVSPSENLSRMFSFRCLGGGGPYHEQLHHIPQSISHRDIISSNFHCLSSGVSKGFYAMLTNGRELNLTKTKFKE